MRPIILALSGLLFAGAAMASSDEAWEEFRAEVKESCAALADDNAQIEVNPFGSESYGIAMITVDYDDDKQERMVCIFDKQSKEAEITGPFTE